MSLSRINLQAIQLPRTIVAHRSLAPSLSPVAPTLLSNRWKQTITRTHQQLVDEANASVEVLQPKQVAQIVEDPDVLVVDLRDPRELEREGKIPGSFHCPRGMLEFWIDPTSPYYKKQFEADRKKIVFYCAGGLRSALSAKTAQDMGLKPVAHMDGGFSSWKKEGLPVEEHKKRH
ncbi:Rhodanese-like protein [Gonapodya prolifera JEL478]|uniref:Rhodanese-like protein n=1 Tax=Gonapodya prolifera (strain JEL478) TaxID=1344416 RepID=A0A139AJ28_GONPJ|nr:Rhodanese-like protein [Gonapodya prolifera JEL478]|eukprot:KXS16797.1 Rhodanese-like protein [Gonapodya prolifera JEL478]